jgi:hypothetical protein
MPIPLSNARRPLESADRGGASDAEVRRLRQEIETLRDAFGGEGHSLLGGAAFGWAAIALSVLGVLLGLFALLK